MDPTKVQAIHNWSVPRSAKAMHGFLGLAGYYLKFAHNFGSVATLLTALLKKEGLSWIDAAAAAFDALKAAITSALVLAMLDFTMDFTVECDASSHGFDVVLIQDVHLIAFSSRLVAPRRRSLAAYEQELIGLIHTIRH
jgi:hypothetical protein